MNVLYVYSADWPLSGATRVGKQVRSLQRAGHAVSLVCRNFSRRVRREEVAGVSVHRMPAARGTLLNRALNFPFFFNPIWLWVIYQAARVSGASVLIVRDLPLAPTTIVAGWLLGRPVVFDMAEIYPEFLRGLFEFDKMTSLDHLVRNPRAAEIVEQWVLRRADLTVVVSEESRLRCLGFGVPEDRLLLVTNTPEGAASYTDPVAAPPEYAAYAGRRVVLFVGTIIGDRGVDDAIRAMPPLLARVPDALLVIVGEGRGRPAAEAAVRELGLANAVHLLGWKEHDSLVAYYRHSHVGILPFRAGKHVSLTLANKLFDYMAAELAMVASDLPSTRRIVDDAQCGLLVPASDPGALGAALATLLGDDGLRKGLAAKGRRAALARYSWEVDGGRLVAAVERLGAAAQASTRQA